MKTKHFLSLVMASFLSVFLKANEVSPFININLPFLTASADSIAPVANSTFSTSELIASNGIKLNPRAHSFVNDYISRNSQEMEKLEDWGRPYFNMMDAVFKKNNLPVELKYLAVIESKLKSNAVSWAGAVGPWQFMPATARGYGLKVTRTYDERRDIVKSTHAAARYLKYLYTEFNDWLLVIAAYNGGPGVVNSAIRKSGSRNFWKLQHFLPAESRNHVKKFIATHYIFEGQGGITTLTRSETKEQIREVSNYLVSRNLTPQELQGAKTKNISGKYQSEVIARHILMDISEFNRYNPNFDKLMASEENSYHLKLPAKKMELFVAKKYQILNESVNLLLNAEATAPSTPSDNSSTLVMSK